MSTSEVGAPSPRVLFVYYTHTKQALRVADAMAEAMRARGCDVTQAGIEFTDPRYVDGIRFTYEGGQIRSLLSLLSYFGKGEMRERSYGIKIPPTNLKPDFGDQATAFANKLVDTLKPAALSA